MVRAAEVSGAILVKTVSAHALRPQRLGYDVNMKSRICPFSRSAHAGFALSSARARWRNQSIGECLGVVMTLR